MTYSTVYYSRNASRLLYFCVSRACSAPLPLFLYAATKPLLFHMASLDSVLLALIVDHCNKNGWHAAADRLRADAREKGFHGINLPPAFRDGPNSFLTDWYVPTISSSLFSLVFVSAASLVVPFLDLLCPKLAIPCESLSVFS